MVSPFPPLRLAVAAAAATLALAASAAAEPVRMRGEALGLGAEIEVRDLAAAAAEAAIGEAFGELAAAPAALRALEAAAAGSSPLALAPDQAELVRRTLGFCAWTQGALGPLGSHVYRLWGVRTPVSAQPTPEAVAAAVGAAACDRARFDERARTLSVAPGSALDFYPFELGWSVDRAASRLRARGATNFWIEIGPLRLGSGVGPDGLGWPVAPPLVAGQQEPLATFHLRDRAAALPTALDRPLAVAGDEFTRFFDLRRGRPASGVAAVLVVTELAVDADAVAHVMFALGPSPGSMLLGNISPRPSIRWLLGSGEGPPLLTDINWGIVTRH